ncbi:putative signal transducing protein [Williamwhitmania taraxaci]|uniref:Putative signal transducing protein n=1 Tax=Williamwhitmania taraxaci TaxID=1640674 RepID=A0A1G6SGX2_9BACT|nr:DUF2007 domain-containing protein [Williamwhitmania taraxaci]SDD15904.1 Putative signal transducing protein [Williamwhitmania taraxaci]
MENELVKIFVGELWQATIVKELLNDNGISAFIENELMGNIAPWQIAAGGSASVTVMIANSDYALAKPLVDEFTNGSNPLPVEDE